MNMVYTHKELGGLYRVFFDQALYVLQEFTLKSVPSFVRCVQVERFIGPALKKKLLFLWPYFFDFDSFCWGDGGPWPHAWSGFPFTSKGHETTKGL